MSLRRSFTLMTRSLLGCTQPYTSKGQRTVKNDQDGIFQNGGNQLMLSLAEVSLGYAATFDIGLQN